MDRMSATSLRRPRDEVLMLSVHSHRIGQYRPVVVTRLIIENSIESRILELQRKKEAMTSSTLGDDDSGLGRLTPEDLQFLFSL